MQMFRVDSEKMTKGLHRLLAAPKDVDRWDTALGDVSMTAVSDDHRRLFAAYIRDLGPATSKAVQIWDDEVEWNANASGDRPEALSEQWMTYPAGPAAQPFFVALVRRYWLACDALNRKVPPASGVTPETFLLGWLMHLSPQQDEAVNVLACMPYWPLGMDHDGNWV
jgi:hypothetical protein